MFAYRLASHLGILDVDQMLDSISVRQFNEWMAFNIIDPFVRERNDLNTALLASLYSNSKIADKNKLTVPADFMPYNDEPKKKVKKMTIGEAIKRAFGVVNK